MGIFVGTKIQEDLERQVFNLQRRVIRDRSNPFVNPEKLFKGLYRLPKIIAMNLINALEPLMVHSLRITSMPNHLKVLCALHFYAHRSYQESVGQDFSLGILCCVIKSTICSGGAFFFVGAVVTAQQSNAAVSSD